MGRKRVKGPGRHVAYLWPASGDDAPRQFVVEREGWGVYRVYEVSSTGKERGKARWFRRFADAVTAVRREHHDGTIRWEPSIARNRSE